ncbi:MAG: protein-L-isoaspartate O-methyltransferase [Wenzhouxiangellaceae bacterium]
MNLEQARSNMVHQQVRTFEVLDYRVLEVLERIPRDQFVPANLTQLAYADVRLPLGHGQVMMRPMEQGRLLDGLRLKESDRVLEVGTGSGYLTACLAALAHRVTSIEYFEDLAEQARERLAQIADLDRIALSTGDILGAKLPSGSFDAVVVTASVASVPQRFIDLLAPEGRLFIVRGHAPIMEAVVLARTADGGLTETSLFDTDLPRLIGAEDAPVFSF